MVAEVDGRVAFANPAALRLFGAASEAEVLGRPLIEFIAPESRETLEIHRRAWLAGEPVPKRYRLAGLRRDGSRFEFEIVPVGIEIEGRPVGGASLRAIREPRNGGEQPEDPVTRYRALFDLAPIGIYRALPDGTIQAANGALAALLGYDSPEDLRRVRIADLYLDPAERRFGPGGASKTLETRWLKKNGAAIWIELDAHAIEDDTGRTMSYEGFVRDVTPRRLAEEDRGDLERQLAQSQKMEAVGRLAGGIAHDFNNLLTSIAGYSELLLSSIDTGDPRRMHATEIRRAGEKAAVLTRQLLAFSRRQVLEPRVIDLNAVVDSMQRMLSRTIGEDVSLATILSEGTCRVRADPGQIEQAILNLVVNARDAMPRGGRLTIETSRIDAGDVDSSDRLPMAPGSYCVVAVTDTGSGMSAEVKSRLFEPFFTTKEIGKGTGLGLSTTYGIVKQSGGYIWCSSEPDHGTRFEIYLPRVEQALPLREAELEPAVAGTPRNDEKILLVEDEPEVRNLVLKLLQMQGYDVVAAGGPDEALEILRKRTERIDLMITDVVMPGMSGRQLADRLKTTHPEIKVLFVSGFTDDAIVHHGMLLPGTAFLQKPFTPAALHAKVRDVLTSPPRIEGSR